MIRAILTHVRSARRVAEQRASERQRGNVIVFVALLLPILMGLGGAGVDYGLGVFEAARLQNSLDAAALAGARSMVTSSGGATAGNVGKDSATTYLGLHGYWHGLNGVNVTMKVQSSNCAAWTGRTWNGSAWDGSGWNCPAPAGTVWPDTMRVEATHVMPTHFWRMIGIENTTITRTATAAAGADFVDVMLSLDLSHSMELSGTNDLQQLRNAVVTFIDQMRVDPAEPRGSRVGIARWAGIRCSWHRGVIPPTATPRAGRPTATPAPVPAGVPDGDAYLEVDRAEYREPCEDDMTVLHNVTQNRDVLRKIANNLGSATCPTVAAQQPLPSEHYGCALDAVGYNLPVTHGTPIPTTTTTRIQQNGTTPSDFGYGWPSNWTRATGTKLPNGLNVARRPDNSYNAWTVANSGLNGARNNAAGEGNARKVLVLMTDGFNEINSEVGVPRRANGTPGPTPTTLLGDWNTEVGTRATAIKAGADNNLATTDDNVEIYVIGFFCGAAPNDNIPNKWCQSTLARNTPHKCPGTWPVTGVTPSSVDNLLYSISSSTPGTCDHYFPITKTESLPELFRVIAGSVARSRLE